MDPEIELPEPEPRWDEDEYDFVDRRQSQPWRDDRAPSTRHYLYLES